MQELTRILRLMSVGILFALNNGIPIEIVAKMLGHTNIRTTQIYAKVLNSEVERGFDLLESKIKK